MTSNETWRRIIPAVEAETGVLIAEHGARRIWRACDTPAKRHGDKHAASVRRLVNNKWTEEPVSRGYAAELAAAYAAAPLAVAHKSESGRRILVRCWLPSGTPGAYSILANLAAEINAEVGGFTRIFAVGFWRGESEAGHVYEVSTVPARADIVVLIFERAGRALLQEWTHITTTDERARHANTAPKS